MTPTELAEIDADRARARRVFVGWLVLATALTLAGNAAAAVLPSLPATAVRLAVHLLPPLIALVGLHALTALARAGAIHRARKGATAALRDAGPVYAAATAGVLGIAALAVTLSYAGLIAVARAGGLSHGLAALWPLTIDLGIAVSTMAMLVLRPISAADQRAARRAASATASSATQRRVAASDAAPTREPQVRTTVSHVGESPTASLTDAADEADESATVMQQHLDRAAHLAQSGAVAKPVEEIAEVLALLDEAVSERRIGSITGWSTNTVAKLRKADAVAAAAHLRLTAVH
jgi:hypothetical protein